MDEEMIRRWNSVVKPLDKVYHLGDFALGGDDKYALSILKRLNGYLHLIEGNHDMIAWRLRDYFASFNHGFIEIEACGKTMTLCHYAMKVWHKSHHGRWLLYGHSHGTLPDDPNSLSFDVGVDCHDFTPLHFDQVADIMKKKTFKPVDHHCGETT